MFFLFSHKVFILHTVNVPTHKFNLVHVQSLHFFFFFSRFYNAEFAV